MDIKGLRKAKVLAALFNKAKAQGIGKVISSSYTMTTGEAQFILDDGCYSFDYLQGRVMKIDLSGNQVDTFLYNRDNGEGAAEKIIEGLFKVKD